MVSSGTISSDFTYLTEFIDEKADEFQAALRLYHEKRVKGFIFVGSRIDERAKVMDGVDVPMVFATVSTAGTLLERASSVSIDDRAMSREVIEALLRSGHRRIAVFGGDRTGGDCHAMRYLGVLFSGFLAGVGGFAFAIAAGSGFQATVAGYGFLALAVMIFGNLKPLSILGASLFFAFFKII